MLMLVLLLTGAPDLLTFMPEISIIGAFGVAALKSLEKEATDNLRKTYTEFQLLDPQVMRRLEEPSHWWVYSIILFVASAAAFFAYDSLPSEVLSRPSYPETMLLVAAFLFALAMAYFVIIVLLNVFWKSEKVFAAAHGIGNGLRVGTGIAAILSVLAIEYISVLVFVIVGSGLYSGGIASITLYGLILSVASELSLIGGIAVAWSSVNFTIGKESPFGDKRFAFSALLSFLPIIVVIVNSVLS